MLPQLWYQRIQTGIQSHFLLETQGSCCSLKTSAFCSAAPDQFRAPPLVGQLPAPLPHLAPPCFTLSFHAPTPCNTLPSEKVINHNYLRLWQSPSHSSAHSVTLSSLTALHPQLPSCPLPLLFFPCSTLQEINVTVRPFIYLERRCRWEGTRRATAAPDIFGLIINMRHWLCIRVGCNKVFIAYHHDQSVPCVHNSFTVLSSL